MVNKDGVLEVRSEGLGRGRIHWVGEARKGGDASKGCEVIREHAAERSLQNTLRARGLQDINNVASTKGALDAYMR